MLPIIAKWSILDGKRDEALDALRDLAAIVKEKEPFVLMYTINTPNFEQTSFPTPPANEVVFVSVFQDKESFEIHLNGLFKEWLEKNKHLFLTNNGSLFVVSEWLQRQYGFVRSEMAQD